MRRPTPTPPTPSQSGVTHDQKRLLNSQTGKLEKVRVRPKGTDRVETGAGEVAAKRYDLSAGKLNIELWYNDRLGWVGLASNTDKGRRLTYRRM